jgi:hypothetical protein
MKRSRRNFCIDCRTGNCDSCYEISCDCNMKFAHRPAQPAKRNTEAKGQNQNCLEGMSCPRCGSAGPFKIAATALFTLTDNGAEAFGDLDYDADSYCACCACGHDRIVREFADHQ